MVATGLPDFSSHNLPKPTIDSVFERKFQENGKTETQGQPFSENIFAQQNFLPSFGLCVVYFFFARKTFF
jgi:hypothetical protein